MTNNDNVFISGASLPFEVARIVDGEEIEIGDTPWQVSLQNLGVHFCGGAIITRYHGLTAAHCVDDPALVHYLKVRVGSTNHNSGGLLKAIRSVMIHEKYNSPLPSDNDIAVMHFKYPLQFSLQVQAIRLPSADSEVAANTSLILTGWGFTSSSSTNQEDLTEVLLASEVNSVEQGVCVRAHGTFTEGDNKGQARVTDNMLCATNLSVGGNDACNVSVAIAVAIS